MTGRSLFAVVPAAGHSRRMGRPKLLLPVEGETVVARLLDALAHPRITATIVVARRDDTPLADEVARTKAIVVRPDVDPPDMRASVEHAIAAIAERFDPDPDDGWLLVPADHPSLRRAVLDELTAAWDECDGEILIPTFEGRRGHPTVFRWRLAAEVASIPPDRGLDALVAAHEPREVAIADRGIVTDLDTPEDYQRLRADRSTTGPADL